MHAKGKGARPKLYRILADRSVELLNEVDEALDRSASPDEIEQKVKQTLSDLGNEVCIVIHKIEPEGGGRLREK